MERTVGMIGLGLMGTAISVNLLKADYRVIGYDIDPERVEALEKNKGIGAASCREVADAAAVVITSLPSVTSFMEVLNGSEGISRSERSRLVVIDTSTLPLEAKEEGKEILQGSGKILLDCPLSGTAAQAMAKDITVFGSGDKNAYDGCKSIFESFARSHFFLGKFGTGSIMKFIANLLVAIHNVSAAEALVLGMKAGLDPETIYEVIGDSAGSSRMFEVRGPLMVSEKYDQVTMKVDVFQKDIEIITSFARKLLCPTPLFSSASQIYMMALAEGYAGSDTASVCAVMEKQASYSRLGDE